MRRQARVSTSGTHVVHTASALQVWLWLLIFVFQNEFWISRSIQPGYLDFDNLPETNFTCTGKVIGGYYADLETSCQMFHVCTVGQQDEPMDIKFLCLNGTVFDQETRVCERVDEVDCTKSEKFYSLNLELYGSTAPPIIQAESSNNQAQPTEQSQHQAKPSQEPETDPSTDELSTTSRDKTQQVSTEVIDSTEDPTQDIKKYVHNSNISYHPHKDNVESEEYQDEDEIDEYEDDYPHSSTTVSQVPVTTTTSTTSTPAARAASSPPPTSPPVVISTSHFIAAPSPSLASIFSHSSLTPSIPPLPTLDPAYLSPQEFIYQHRGAGAEAISFQRQSGRPADGVYITHAPAQQFDHFQYESSRTAPRATPPRPQPFRPPPTPRVAPPAAPPATTPGARDQLLRPAPLPALRPLPFNPYYYERQRSEDAAAAVPVAARSAPPPPATGGERLEHGEERPASGGERPAAKPKSPPRVIVTASASVSDSNGKRLNYTVGNVVSAVKPIVPINYDDYKESDLIFDPFFLDVPKLQKRRKSRSSVDRNIVSVPAGAIAVASSPSPPRAHPVEKSSTAAATSTPAAPPWNPDDYVDDNYEPHAYAPPAVLAAGGRSARQATSEPAGPAAARRQAASEPVGSAVVRRQAASEPAGPAAARRQAASEPVGSAVVRRQAASEPAGPAAARRQAASEPVGSAVVRRQAASEPAGPAVAWRQAASEPAGPAVARRQAASEPLGTAATRRQVAAGGPAASSQSPCAAGCLLRVRNQT